MHTISINSPADIQNWIAGVFAIDLPGKKTHYTDHQNVWTKQAHYTDHQAYSVHEFAFLEVHAYIELQAFEIEIVME